MTDEMSLKKELVKKQRCFSQLTNEEVEVLASLLVKKEIPFGETIVHEGDPADSFYLIAKGVADVRHLRINDEVPQISSVATLSASRWDAIGLNETGFYSLSGLRTATVVAQTDMILYGVTLPVFHGYALMYSHVNQVMRQQSQQYLSSSK